MKHQRFDFVRTLLYQKTLLNFFLKGSKALKLVIGMTSNLNTYTSEHMTYLIDNTTPSDLVWPTQFMVSPCYLSFNHWVATGKDVIYRDNSN